MAERVQGHEAEDEARRVVADKGGGSVLRQQDHGECVVQLIRDRQPRDLGIWLTEPIEALLERAADGGGASIEPSLRAGIRAKTGV